MSAFEEIPETQKPARQIMEEDYSLLLQLKTTPLVRFHKWEGLAATYGCFVEPKRYFNLEGAARHNLELARRPTGGGILFHHVDLSFSLLIPSAHPLYGSSALDSYRMVHTLLLNALSQLPRFNCPVFQESPHAGPHERFCMAHPTRYDLLLSGKKVAGAAQRRMRHGLLHQGSLCLKLPDQAFLSAVLQEGTSLYEAMEKASFPLEMDEEECAQFKRLFLSEL